jgi:hypothetical protein
MENDDCTVAIKFLAFASLEYFIFAFWKHPQQILISSTKTANQMAGRDMYSLDAGYYSKLLSSIDGGIHVFPID